MNANDKRIAVLWDHFDQERYRKLRALLISPDRRWDLLTFVEHSKSQSIEEFDAVVDILPELEAK